MKSIVPDDKLLEGIRSGNERALHLLYKKYKPLIFQFVNRQIRDVGTSEELVQDVFIAVLDAVRDDAEIRTFSAYIYSVARHKIIDYLRKKKLKKIVLSAIPETIFNSCATLLFNDFSRKQELAESVEGILDLIPHEYALIIRLKYIDGFSVRKIADKLTINFKAAESKLFRARKLFAKVYAHLNS